MNKLNLVSLLGLLAVTIISSKQVEAWWMFDPQPIRAEAKFDMDGVTGSFKFQQLNADSPTKVDYDLFGLKGNNKLYHVHVRPVPAFDSKQAKNNATLLASLCSDPSTGGHLNPHHIKEKLPPKSAPFDKYELGDLSSKHGSLQDAMAPHDDHQDFHPGDHHQGSFIDDKISLKGDNALIGRSIVIHKNDGKRWVCANIVETTNF